MKFFIPVIRNLVPALLIVLISTMAQSQCIPLGPDGCPDPENNGEICPDTLPVGYLNEDYGEVATILVPIEVVPGVDLHHLTLIEVGNLPTGLTWVSNSINNEFLAGNYYCILMEGVPEIADTFYLKIVIDVYILFGGQEVYYGRRTDSTSLSMIIIDGPGIDELADKVEIKGNFPNPFTSQTNIVINASGAGEMNFEVYSMLGQKVHYQKIFVRPGENHIRFDGETLPPGIYNYVFKYGNRSLSGIMYRAY